MTNAGRRRGGWAVGIVSGLALTTMAGAAPAPPVASAESVRAVIACRDIAESAARLACFDKAVGEMDQAEKKGDLLTLDREQRRQVRRQAFGLALPSFNLFDRGEKPEEANRLSAKVASARQDGAGRWIVTLDDGAVWAQTDDNEIRRPPRPGLEVVISRGALGSFFMKVEGNQSVRAKRVS